MPMHRDLQTILVSITEVGQCYPHEQEGQLYTTDGFRSSWRKEFDRPVMKLLRKAKLVFHGLRKSSVVFLLEAGCADAEVSAITVSRDKWWNIMPVE